ncbi:MAG: hypothetical protein JW786_03980 [Desulfobacterales bacterium]|nr:hypothetical protein [Desulfobacterales bacterium]
MEQTKNNPAIKAVEKIERLLSSEQILLSEFSSDGTVFDNHMKLVVTCWVPQEDRKISEKQK